MSETEKNVNVEKSCDCEAIKAELETTKQELEQAREALKQYDAAYKELQVKYNRLYGILGNTIDYSLGIK